MLWCSVPSLKTRPQQHLIGDMSQFLASKHWIIWIGKGTTDCIYQIINASEKKHKVAENRNAQLKNLKIVLQKSSNHWLSEKAISIDHLRLYMT